MIEHTPWVTPLYAAPIAPEIRKDQNAELTQRFRARAKTWHPPPADGKYQRRFCPPKSPPHPFRRP
jgi:hypothetical protein